MYSYEQVQTAVDKIVSGIYRFQRLNETGERGPIKGTRLFGGSSLVIGGQTGTNEESRDRKTRDRGDGFLEAYAKNEPGPVTSVSKGTAVKAPFQRIFGLAPCRRKTRTASNQSLGRLQ